MKLYKIAQALSLDVVLGISIFSVAIGRYYGVALSWHVLVGLCIAIWLIYTTDHLLDAQKISAHASTYRHRFHQEFQKPLIIAGVLLFVAGLINMLYLPSIVLYTGLLLGLITIIYFVLLQKYDFWVKELCVAVIYTLGASTGPVALTCRSLTFIQWLLVPQVFLMAFANLLLFSWFDMVKDRIDGHRSMVIHLGRPRAGQILKISLMAGVVCCVIIMLFKQDIPMLMMQSVLLVMYTTLAFIFRYNSLLIPNDLYRIIGDGIFYLPLIYILYAR